MNGVERIFAGVTDLTFSTHAPAFVTGMTRPYGDDLLAHLAAKKPQVFERGRAHPTPRFENNHRRVAVSLAEGGWQGAGFFGTMAAKVAPLLPMTVGVNDLIGRVLAGQDDAPTATEALSSLKLSPAQLNRLAVVVRNDSDVTRATRALELLSKLPYDQGLSVMKELLKGRLLGEAQTAQRSERRFLVAKAFWSALDKLPIGDWNQFIDFEAGVDLMGFFKYFGRDYYAAAAWNLDTAEWEDRRATPFLLAKFLLAHIYNDAVFVRFLAAKATDPLRVEDYVIRINKAIVQLKYYAREHVGAVVQKIRAQAVFEKTREHKEAYELAQFLNQIADTLENENPRAKVTLMVGRGEWA